MDREHAESQPPGDTLRLKVPGPHPDAAIEVRPRATEHPLLGVCDVVAVPGGPALTCFGAVNWQAPRAIPAMERPAALPGGAGSAILNLLAERALVSGRQPLRYVGPYPTNALFDTLLSCFRLEQPVADARARFTANVEHTALSGAMDEVPVNFWPDPFTRVFNAERNRPDDNGTPVCVQIRRGVEAVFVGGRAYRRDAAGVDARRLRPAESNGDAPDSFRAVIEFGGQVWAEIARVDASGALLDGPHPVPAVRNTLVGKPLPVGIRRALARALPGRAPRVLQSTLARVIAETPLYWADTGDVLARYNGQRAEVHAALPGAYGEAAAAALLDVMARALEPVFQRLGQAELARALAAQGDSIADLLDGNQ